MKRWAIFCISLYLNAAAFGQLTERNPVDELKDEVITALASANLPLTPVQEKQLTLLIEEERQAAENLFGITWDFSKGPPQGEDRDQALAGIQWMYEELKKTIPEYMTDTQRAAWETYTTRSQPVEPATEDSPQKTTPKVKIQQIRVTNNAFNVETGQSAGARGPTQGGAKTEVIERGGSGAFHGKFASTFQDEKLNARNPFATNKPPYYERTIDAILSGPIILPTDIYLTTAINGKSGNAYTITTGIDNNKDGVINDRPPGLKKNTEFGPGLFDIGFNISKAFELSNGTPSGPQVNVFANLNNAFNTTHPGTPSGVMTSPFFRKPYNATSPRTVELGMRFQF